MEIHASDLITFLSCRRKFYYSNVRRILPIEYEEPTHFKMGLLGHKVLQKFYAGDESYKDLIEELNTSVDENDIILRSCLKRFFETYAIDEELTGANIVSSDVSYDVELCKDITLKFTPDIVVKTPSGGVKIYDHKFLKRFPSEDSLVYNSQANIYLWGMNRVGVKARRFTLNIIKKVIPVPPLTLKNGNLTRAKSELDKTTKDMYLTALELHGFRKEDYAEELKHFDTRIDPFFRRMTTVRSSGFLEHFDSVMKSYIDELKRVLDQGNYYPVYSNECRKCLYNELCTTQSEGGPVETTIETLFREKELTER